MTGYSSTGSAAQSIVVTGSLGTTEGETLSEAPKTTIKMGTDTYDIYTIMNVSPFKRKVILKKVAKDTYSPLAGAKYRIFRADLSEVINADYGDDEAYTSGSSGVYFIDTLPEGKYYLVETAVPTGAVTDSADKIFVLEV